MIYRHVHWHHPGHRPDSPPGPRRRRPSAGRHRQARPVGVALGDSIAVNGVCLTAVALRRGVLGGCIARDPLADDTGRAQGWQPGEPGEGPDPGHAARWAPGQRACGRSGGVRSAGRWPAPGAAHPGPGGARPVHRPEGVHRRGRISLTVNGVDGREFELNIVPHTLAETMLGGLAPAPGQSGGGPHRPYLERCCWATGPPSPRGGVSTRHSSPSMASSRGARIFPSGAPEHCSLIN